MRYIETGPETDTCKSCPKNSLLDKINFVIVYNGKATPTLCPVLVCSSCKKPVKLPWETLMVMKATVGLEEPTPPDIIEKIQLRANS